MPRRFKSRQVIGLALALLLVAPADAAPRSAKVRAWFQSLNPCPSTGQRSGPCPGYVADHITALACGGPDHPDNLQWQRVADAKAKDRWELNCGKLPPWPEPTHASTSNTPP